MNTKICTSIVQSKKLLSLGIDLSTADMHYMYRHWEIDENTVGAQSDANIGFNSDFYYSADNGKTYHYIPAWSLTALLELFDNRAGIAKEYEYWFAYNNDKSHCSKHSDNPLDAAFEIVCWLIEQGHIKVKE